VFLDARIRQETQGLAHDTAVADAMSLVEAQLGRPGASLDAQLSSFFDAFAALADDPGSLTLRDAAARESDRLAVAFRDMSERLGDTREHMDLGVRAAVDEINTLVGRLAELNARVESARGGDYESLIDTRTALLTELSGLTGITVSESSGTLTVSLTSGEMLLSGAVVAPLSIENEAGTGRARVMSGGQDITASITTGTLGGRLQMRDDKIPGYVAALDQIAYDVANAVNAANASGTDALGNPGGILFDISATPTGAAASMRLTAAVANDSRLISAAGAGANDAARAIASLRNATLVNGVTPTAAWGQLMYRVGADSADAQRAQTGRQQIMTQLQLLREAASGVSIDEEAASLMRYQRAYEANARYFSVVNSLLDTLFEAVR
jgi:flagellar hook-associated protein 1 FlgK